MVDTRGENTGGGNGLGTRLAKLGLLLNQFLNCANITGADQGGGGGGGGAFHF